jgi:hypothetical protein
MVNLVRVGRRRYIIALAGATSVAVVGLWWATTASSWRTVGVAGDHVRIPAGWSSEAFVNNYGEAVLRVGSFVFPHDRKDDVGQVAQGAMRADDVLIDVLDVTPTDPGSLNAAYRPVAGSLEVSASQAEGQEGYTIPAAVIRGVRIGGRNFWISVDFGRAPPTAANVAAANAVLRTLGA